MGLFSRIFRRSKPSEVIPTDDAGMIESHETCSPQPLRAGDLAEGDIGAYSWDPAHNAELLTVGNEGKTLEWGPRKPGYSGVHYPPAWVPAKTLLLLHSGNFRLDFIVDEMANRQIGLGFLLAYEGGLLDWGFFGYLGAGSAAWSYDPSTGDVVNETKSIEGGLPKFADGRTGVVTLELELPRDGTGTACFRVQNKSSRSIALSSGAVVVPAACLLEESQRVTLKAG
jgi:hypothetical protein